jgi:hypothetical protein
MTSSFGLDSHQATSQEDVTLLNGVKLLRVSQVEPVAYLNGSHPTNVAQSIYPIFSAA